MMKPCKSDELLDPCEQMRELRTFIKGQDGRAELPLVVAVQNDLDRMAERQDLADMRLAFEGEFRRCGCCGRLTRRGYICLPCGKDDSFDR